MLKMTSAPNVTDGPVFCPLLQNMREHTLNNNSKTNMAVVCVHGVVSCLGILENALIIWVVGFRLRNHTVASVWVLNLALSDFLATLTLPLFTFYFYSSHSWELSDALCSLQASIFFLNMFVSAFLLAAISLDRYLLVVKPVWSKNHRTVVGAWKVCAFGWLWAAVNTIPYFLFRAVTMKEDGRKLCYHNFALYSSPGATLMRDCKVRQAATAISKLLLAFLMPLLVILLSYIQMCISLKKRRKWRKQSTIKQPEARSISSKNETPEFTNTLKTTKMTKSIFRKRKASSQSHNSVTFRGPLSKSFTKMVMFVIAVFVLCWAPYHIFCILEVVAQYRPPTLLLVDVGLPIASTFSFLNPVLNPILYTFSCPNFCVRIRQNLGTLFDGLVEEGGGILMAPARTIRAQIRRRSSEDTSLPSPVSKQSPHSPLQAFFMSSSSSSQYADTEHV
ncbi:prostaglandin D2 receptor 2 [Thalassophryne amazonica]|uniref:prostaglandin D2 receptor 2 n=1 Tax=Thalassophryne amazonica TaxID=390379 RepID=UPI00147109B5|nr:prostaglandin D2 receptor 2 [Thalassophryne amazonica]XP_034045020.1 prostaglandin D2 receptor 2 [Thalassophryne amazonica]